MRHTMPLNPLFVLVSNVFPTTFCHLVKCIILFLVLGTFSKNKKHKVTLEKEHLSLFIIIIWTSHNSLYISNKSHGGTLNRDILSPKKHHHVVYFFSLCLCVLSIAHLGQVSCEFLLYLCEYLFQTNPTISSNSKGTFMETKIGS